MKRILILLAAVTMLMTGLSAQTRTLVTLSHDGQLTFFDKVSAFEDAVTAAVDGDIIYLSEGKFGASTQSFTIQDKKISIVGCGYNSHIIPNITFQLTGEDAYLSAPLFDGVRLEQLSFGTTGQIMDNIQVKKCYIYHFTVYTNSNNILIDRCKINTYRNSYGNKNIKIYNSKINSLNSYNCEIIENCNIKQITGNQPSYTTNSIISGFSGGYSNGIFENCLIVSKNGASSNTDFRSCYAAPSTEVLDDDLECTIEDMSEYVGLDGTVVGIYGGEWFPYSETPTVPTVDSANSSVEYDKEGNKLNVTITVAPN